MENQTEDLNALTAHYVGVSFAQEYYNTLHKNPDMVHKYYVDSSVATVQLINEAMHSLNCKTYRTDIRTIDSQFSYKEGVVVLVMGWFVGNGQRKRFAQSFFLSPQELEEGRKAYYILNDVLRFVNDEDGSSPTLASELLISIEDQSGPSETTSAEVEVNVEVVKEPIFEIGDAALDNGHGDENGHATENGVAEKPVDPVKTEAPRVNATTTEETDVPPPKKSFSSVVSALKQNNAPFQQRAPLPKPVRAPATPKKPVASISTSVPAVNGAPEKNTGSAPAKAYAIFVPNLPMNATVEELDKVFKQFGPIKHDGIQVRSSKQQGTCFGFVEFESASSMQSALDASPVAFGPRKLSIEERRATNDRSRFSSGRGGYNQSRGGRGNFNGNNRGGFGRGRGNNNNNNSARNGVAPNVNGGNKAATPEVVSDKA